MLGFRPHIIQTVAYTKSTVQAVGREGVDTLEEHLWEYRDEWTNLFVHGMACLADMSVGGDAEFGLHVSMWRRLRYAQYSL